MKGNTMITTLEGMTQAQWDSMTSAEREAARDNSALTAQLVGLEGWRVEVVDMFGQSRRFIVGKSTGWCPCHLEVLTRRSRGGGSADKWYRTVRRIERVR